MIPFYIYYSMFGFQRVGDLAWAAGDMRARGFLLGGTAGRTTLAGEGLQHTDGHSHIFSSVIPNCISYDPTFSYELAVIIQEGLRRMFVEQEDVYYYITLMNENYYHPDMPEGAEEGIIKGMYLYQEAQHKENRVQLLGSGTILREVIAAAQLLESVFKIGADVWSVTSFTELRREGLDLRRQNLLNPDREPLEPYVSKCLNDKTGPIIAASDYIRLFADQIREFIKQPYYVLGTDGFGRSDTRKELRYFFEVNAPFIAYTAIKALADQGKVPIETVHKAIERYDINPDKPNPMTA
jgi:pyruvate dehydrogenase E1 component